MSEETQSAAAVPPASPAPEARPIALPVDAIRVLSQHLLPESPDGLLIEVLDERGPSGASSCYNVAGFYTATNPSDPFVARYGKPADHATVLMQNGPIGRAGRNGVTVEALLAIAIDQLDGFQSGPSPCDENRAALQLLVRALEHLHARTRRRLAQGTEGTPAGS